MFRFFKKKKQVPQHIFKMYDIRGLADEELSSDVMRKIGQSYGTVCLNKDVHQLVVASDARLSSPELKGALIDGLLSTGCTAIDVGNGPNSGDVFCHTLFGHQYRTDGHRKSQPAGVQRCQNGSVRAIPLW